MRVMVNSPTFWVDFGIRTAPLLSTLRDPVGPQIGCRAPRRCIYEDTKATNLERDGVGVLVTTQLGQIRWSWPLRQMRSSHYCGASRIAHRSSMTTA